MLSLTKIGLLVSLAEINTKKGQYTTATEQDIGLGKAIFLNDFSMTQIPILRCVIICRVRSCRYRSAGLECNLHRLKDPYSALMDTPVVTELKFKLNRISSSSRRHRMTTHFWNLAFLVSKRTYHCCLAIIFIIKFGPLLLFDLPYNSVG